MPHAHRQHRAGDRRAHRGAGLPLQRGGCGLLRSPRRPRRRCRRSRASCMRERHRQPLARRAARGRRRCEGGALGAIERGVVRVLGLATEAVHLIGRDESGADWVQLRAIDEVDRPGPLGHADGRPGRGRRIDRRRRSARETMEEAGLDARARCASSSACAAAAAAPAGARGLHGRAHRASFAPSFRPASCRSTATARSSASSASSRARSRAGSPRGEFTLEATLILGAELERRAALAARAG